MAIYYIIYYFFQYVKCYNKISTSVLQIPLLFFRKKRLYFEKIFSSFFLKKNRGLSSKNKRTAQMDFRSPFFTILNRLERLTCLFINQLRCFAVRQAFFCNDHLFDVLLGGDFIHDLRHDTFDNRAKPARTRL